MAVNVHLLPAVRQALVTITSDLLERELAQVFNTANQVTAYRVIEGFEPDQTRKIILAVETHTRPRATRRSTSNPTGYRLHIVKLGLSQSVAADYDNWQRHVEGRQVSNRMFVHLAKVELAPAPGTVDPRAAVIYADASQLYGPLSKDEAVLTLDEAVDKAIWSTDVCALSIERVLRQAYAELGRWFYHPANADPAAAAGFYRGKLREENGTSETLELWKSGLLWQLRADAIWLLCGPTSPEVTAPPNYLDPCDYVQWLLQHRTDKIPPTLVGRSHGDFHGRNVVLGVSRGEAEYPVIIDYGDISDRNALVWDFVKLETELKVRILHALFNDAPTRKQVFAEAELPHLRTLVQRWSERESHDDRERRAQLLLFGYLFERLLAKRTASILRIESLDGPLSAHGESSPLERALTILRRIRLECAGHLGQYERRPAANDWRNEYHFALAVYGLNTAKFPDQAYPEFQRIFALVSAGCAIAQWKADAWGPDRGEATESGPDELWPMFQSPVAALPPGPYPSYLVPLHHGFRLWNENTQLDTAEELLRDGQQPFSHSVPARREYALVLATLGKLDEAQAVLEKIPSDLASFHWTNAQEALIRLCDTFGDFETLSRVGRTYKDLADRSWQSQQPLVPFELLGTIAARQWYLTAYEYYKAAFEFSGDHFPGGNAAVTALLADLKSDAAELADEVLVLCGTIRLGKLSPENRYWVLATESTLSLVVRKPQQAAEFMKDALGVLPKGSNGAVRSSYQQLCRLYHALGSKDVQPVLDVLKSCQFTIAPGPLGDCDGAFSPETISQEQ